ncbi:LuxR C-terminal-related transcriptional regulator [uncultured Herbaspirillum sp.]|uniref:response regulator transcription factor n=1 Tax=uncultured Herbaspirillum sp. TaxID=160236 RepID=UPI0026217832|nr:LuxR C-terminal-related transcriptional regulator [uncultured Herbaspirillum sp.]
MTTAHLAHIVGGEDSLGGPLVRLLEAAGFHVAHHSSAAQFLQHTTGSAPGGLVLEVHMQNLDARRLRSLLDERELGRPLIVITGHTAANAPEEMYSGHYDAGPRALPGAASEQGAQPMVRQQLVEAFRGALMPFDESGPQMQQRQEHYARLKTLTRREREVLERLVKGRLNKQIAAELGTSERTVKAHRQQVMRKMNADSLAALVAAMTRY